jgi:hypothetical protein
VFDEFLKEVQRLESGVQLTLDFEADENGYIDRICPSDECGTHFKVSGEDFRDRTSDIFYCPLCRFDAEPSEWNTPEQLEYIQNTATAYLQEQFGQALQKDALKFNARQSRNDFIQLSFSYKPGHIPTPVPAEATELMTQVFVCEKCNFRYSSIGAAFFCPACGYNSVLDTFSNSLETVQKTIAAIPTIRQAIMGSANENVAEDSIRHICENGLVKIVSSFQRYAEACFDKLSNANQFNIRRNLFQNLAESDSVWRNATSTGYAEILNQTEYQSLIIYFQQRHLLAHQDGIVDQQYLDRTGDQRFRVNQRLIVTESGVSELAVILEKLSSGIAALT